MTGRRIERFHSGNITPEMRELFEETSKRIKAKRDSSPAMKALMDGQGRLNGPPSLWLLSPGVGKVFEAMQGAIRSTIAVAPRCMEIVILMVGRHCNSEFEIFAHKLAAKAVGISDSEVQAILDNRDPGLTDPIEKAAAAATHALLANGSLTDTQYADAIAHLGERQLFEIVVLIGFYQAIALQLSVFGVTSQ